MSEGYRSDRVRSWLNPGADPQDSGYQARQAKFALANGGVFGDGLGQGTAKWNYLPNAHNDFIFAIIGEELGFIGAFGPAVPIRPVRLHGHADRAPVGRPVPAAAHRHRHDVGARPGVHQRRLRHRAAARHRPAAAADLGGWNINGDNAFDHRDDRQRGPARARGGGRAARRPRRPGEPAAAAAAARTVRPDAHRGAARPACARGRRHKPTPKAPRKPAKKRKPAQTPAADRSGRRSRHHGGGQRRTGGSGRATRADGLAHGKVNVTGECAPISVVLAGGGTAGHVEPAMAVADALNALDPGCGSPRSAPSAGWRPGWFPSAATTSS